MTVKTNMKQQIYQIIESLPGEQLPDLLQVLEKRFRPSQSNTPTNVAPIYQIQRYAVDTGIPDLAAQHDHYLYGTSKQDV